MAYIAKLTNEGGVKSLNRYVSMLAGNTAFVETAYESIATTTVGAGGAASVTFSSIPSTYTHLQIRYLSGDSRVTSPNSNAYWTFNSDTAANYTIHGIYGTGSVVGVDGSANTSSMLSLQGYLSSFGVGVVDILDYANTNKYKTFRALSGADTNGDGVVYFSSGVWRNTNAVSTITIAPLTANIKQYSSFALYGIKG